MGTGRTGIFEFLESVFGSKRPARKVVDPAEAEARKYHAVKVKAGKDACEWANALHDKRFLATEAPNLPLEDCDALECHCEYVHFKDRRKGPRRGSDLEGHVDRRDAQERRLNRGRRASDYGDKNPIEEYDDTQSYFHYTEEHIADEHKRDDESEDSKS